MEDFKIKLIFPSGNLSEETFTYTLPSSSTILDLKEAYSAEECYTPDELRIVYRKPELDVPLDDSDLAKDIDDQTGQFLIQCPSIGVLDGQFSVKHEETLAVLVGTKANYEHFLLSRLSGSNLKLPLGKKTKFYIINLQACLSVCLFG